MIIHDNKILDLNPKSKYLKDRAFSFYTDLDKDKTIAVIHSVINNPGKSTESRMMYAWKNYSIHSTTKDPIALLRPFISRFKHHLKPEYKVYFDGFLREYSLIDENDIDELNNDLFIYKPINSVKKKNQNVSIRKYSSEHESLLTITCSNVDMDRIFIDTMYSDDSETITIKVRKN